MKSIFEISTQEELFNRINAITQQHQAQWGKMNVNQMVKHCALCDEMYLGKIKIKRVFLGRLIGPIFLRKFLKEGKVFDRNSPTSSSIKASVEREDLEKDKTYWRNLINEYNRFNNPGFVHPFFGPMTKDEIGILAYKHADHHLRQFGV